MLVSVAWNHYITGQEQKKIVKEDIGHIAFRFKIVPVFSSNTFFQFAAQPTAMTYFIVDANLSCNSSSVSCACVNHHNLKLSTMFFFRQARGAANWYKYNKSTFAGNGFWSISLVKFKTLFGLTGYIGVIFLPNENKREKKREKKKYASPSGFKLILNVCMHECNQKSRKKFQWKYSKRTKSLCLTHEMEHGEN